MPTISEPLTEAHAWTFARTRAAFLRGTIGEHTFFASLRRLGLPPQDARAEVGLALMELRSKEAAACRLSR